MSDLGIRPAAGFPHDARDAPAQGLRNADRGAHPRCPCFEFDLRWPSEGSSECARAPVRRSVGRLIRMATCPPHRRRRDGGAGCALGRSQSRRQPSSPRRPLCARDLVHGGAVGLDRAAPGVEQAPTMKQAGDDVVGLGAAAEGSVSEAHNKLASRVRAGGAFAPRGRWPRARPGRHRPR